MGATTDSEWMASSWYHCNLTILRVWNWDEDVPFLASVVDGLEFFPFLVIRSISGHLALVT
jgi:hypothetical protein